MKLINVVWLLLISLKKKKQKGYAKMIMSNFFFLNRNIQFFIRQSVVIRPDF